MKRQVLGVQEGVWAWQQLGRRRRVSRLPRGSGSTMPRGRPRGRVPRLPGGSGSTMPRGHPWGRVPRLPDSADSAPPLLLLLHTTVARTPRSLPEYLLCAKPWSPALLGWSQWSHSTNIGNETVPSPQITTGGSSAKEQQRRPKHSRLALGPPRRKRAPLHTQSASHALSTLSLGSEAPSDQPFQRALSGHYLVARSWASEQQFFLF